MTGEPIPNALSFDIEEYYHALNFKDALKTISKDPLESRVEEGTNRILDVLASYSGKATFFVLGEVGKTHPHLIRKIADAGHEVASHGLSHQPIQSLGKEGFKTEAAESKKRLEDITGEKIRGFRASTFSITEETLWALPILQEVGYRYDSSIFPVYHDRYGIPWFPRNPVQVQEVGQDVFFEFPPLTLHLPGINLPLGGGGYFRLFPPFLTFLAIKRMNRAAFPAVLYFHPWEFDPEQPRHKLGGLKTFRHYHNLRKTTTRMEGLLRRFSFGTLHTLCQNPERWPLYSLKS